MLLNLWCDADLCRAKNTPALFVLHEEHGPQILSLPFSLQGDTRVSIKGNVAVSIRFADLAHEAYHGGMMEVFATVLAQRHRYFCLACCFKNCLPRLPPVAANEFHRPVHHHLRCIRVTVSESPGINILPGRPIPRRERISPAQIVPVIDVLLQGDQLHIPGKRLLGQSRQQSIRWWTTGAAFGCKQFDHYWCASCPGRPRRCLSVWSKQRHGREQKNRSEGQ